MASVARVPAATRSLNLNGLRRLLVSGVGWSLDRKVSVYSLVLRGCRSRMLALARDVALRGAGVWVVWSGSVV